MSFRTTIVLAILAAALGAYVYFYEIKGGEKRKEQEEKAKTLLEIKKEDVAEIRLERNGEAVIIVPAGKDQWQITGPIQSKADEASVGRILNSVEKLQYKEIVDEKPSNLGEYELAKPKTTVQIKVKKGTTHTIKVGARNPVVNVHYVQMNNDPRVYAIEGDLADAGNLTLVDLRDKKMTDFNSEKVQTVRLTTPKLDLEFSKDGGVWKIKTPVESPASDSEVSSLLSSLEFLRAASFVDKPTENPESYGLQKPSATIQLTLDKGLMQKVQFGNKQADQIYCRVEGNPSLALVQDSFSPFFEKDLDGWREKKLVVFNRFDVEEMRIKSAGKEYVFKKGEEEKWRIEGPEKGEVDAEKVQALMEKLEMADILKYGEKASLESAPVLEISMTAKDWQNVITKRNLRFGPVAGEQQPVQNDSYNTIVFVNGATSKQITDDLAGLKPIPPQTQPAANNKK